MKKILVGGKSSLPLSKSIEIKCVECVFKM